MIAHNFGAKMSNETFWLIIGFLGQALFSARFLVQWLVSEMRRESVVPLAFWWFSLGGGVTLLAYAIYRTDPVFITGQGFGLLVDPRNPHADPVQRPKPGAEAVTAVYRHRQPVLAALAFLAPVSR